MAIVSLKANLDQFNGTSNTQPHCTRSQILPCVSNIETGRVFSYHLDEDNEVIYKMVNDESWQQGRGGRQQSMRANKLGCWAEIPQTLAFNYDWALVKFAVEAKNPKLFRTIGRMINLRQAHDIDRFPTYTVPVLKHAESKEPRLLYGACAILNDDGSYSRWTHWDYFLCDAKDASKAMQARRRSEMQGAKKVAEWSKWAMTVLIGMRAEFVIDMKGGYVIERVLETEGEADTRWKLELGYRRAIDALWSGMHGPWDPEIRTEFDKAVIAWWDESTSGHSAKAINNTGEIQACSSSTLESRDSGSGSGSDAAAAATWSITHREVTLGRRRRGYK